MLSRKFSGAISAVLQGFELECSPEVFLKPFSLSSRALSPNDLQKPTFWEAFGALIAENIDEDPTAIILMDHAS